MSTSPPSIASAYRAGSLTEFFRFQPTDLTRSRAERRDVDRVALSDALRAYHRDLGTLDHVVERQLQRLAESDSRVVVTGQQAGLLTGPAYSVHKAVDCLLLARSLDSDSSPVIPVYWVASQDHDAAEVASVTLLDMSEQQHQLRLDLPEGQPVGRVTWQPEWTAQVERVFEQFDAPAPHKERVLSAFRRAARAGSYADVFARLMHELLGQHGLVVLDPLHPALSRLFVPALERELRAPTESSTRIERAAQALERRSFVPQLRRPEGATNLFLECADGQRRLLRWDGRAFHADRKYTREEILGVLHDDPSRVSPAAGLRPVVQDTILPTVAFVVGPGEIAYGAQLRGVYELHDVPQPLLWPRLSVTWLEPPVARILRRFGLSASEFQRDPETTLGAALARERGALAVTEERLKATRDAFEALARDIASLDPTLVGAVKRTEARTVTRLERLQAQARRALIHAEQTRTGQVDRLYRHLLPNGQPQEREMSFLTFVLKHGNVPLDRLLALEAGWTGELTL